MKVETRWQKRPLRIVPIRRVVRKWKLYLAYGRKHITVREPTGKDVRYVIWDTHDCDVIREIAYRREVLQEGWTHIAYLLRARGEFPALKVAWRTRSVKKVYTWYKGIRKLGMNLGEDGVPKSLGNLAKTVGSTEAKLLAETALMGWPMGRPSR